MKTLIEHQTLNGFFKHPYYENLYLSRSGLAYDDDQKEFITPTYNVLGYAIVPGVGKCMYLHRLMCETFLEVPRDIPNKKLVVNHKNGIKSNNCIDNLEWTSYSANNLHAHQNGLKTETTPILVKNLHTNEILRFHSLQACARHFGVNGGKIYHYLKPSTRGVPCFDCYLIIREGDEWPEVGIEAIGKKRPGQPVDILVVDKRLKKYIIFEGATSAAEYTGIKSGTLLCRIAAVAKKGLKFYEDDAFCYGYLDGCLDILPKKVERVAWVNPRKEPLKPNERVASRIEVTDLISEEKRILPSVAVLAEELKVKRGSLQAYLYRHKGIWKNRLKVVYLDVKGPIQQKC